MPPSPEQIAAEKARRRRRREWWAVALALAGILLGIAGEPGWMLAFGGAALALSETLRDLIGRARALWQAWSEPTDDTTSHDIATRDLRDETRDTASDVGVEVVDVTPHPPAPRIPILEPPRERSGHALGPLSVLSFTPRRDGVGDLDVLALIRNNGPPVRHARVTASALVGERIVAMADARVWNLAPGELRSLKLTGSHPYSAHDRIEFQLDELELSP